MWACISLALRWGQLVYSELPCLRQQLPRHLSITTSLSHSVLFKVCSLIEAFLGFSEWSWTEGVTALWLNPFFSPPPFNTSLLFLCLSIFISFFHIFSHYIPPSSTPFQLKLAVMFSLYSSLPLSVFISFSLHRFQPWPLSVYMSLALPKHSGHPGKDSVAVCQMAFLAISIDQMHPFSQQTACEYLLCFVTALQLSLMYQHL